jgi:hypothetical protein
VSNAASPRTLIWLGRTRTASFHLTGLRSPTLGARSRLRGGRRPTLSPDSCSFSVRCLLSSHNEPVSDAVSALGLVTPVLYVRPRRVPSRTFFHFFAVHECLGITILSVSVFCNLSLVADHVYPPSISSRGSYDNLGKRYNVSRIINSDASFNEAEYHAYSPLFLSYVSFLSNPALCLSSFQSDVCRGVWTVVRVDHGDTHACIPVLPQADLDAGPKVDERATGHSRPPYVGVSAGPGVVVRYDIRSVLMLCPPLGNLVLMVLWTSVTMFVFGVISIEVWPTQLPVWAFVLALVIGEWWRSSGSHVADSPRFHQRSYTSSRSE